MDKYSKLSLPSPRLVFEDLSTLHIEQLKKPLKFLVDDEKLQDAYITYFNCKQLRNDINKQQELNYTLEELNKQLMDNIESMKKQQDAASK